MFKLSIALISFAPIISGTEPVKLSLPIGMEFYCAKRANKLSVSHHNISFIMRLFILQQLAISRKKL